MGQPIDPQVWDVTRPERPGRIPGVTMAGFRDRGESTGGHRLIPHPAVTLALTFGPAPLVVDDPHGRQQQGSLVAGLGLGSGALRVGGRKFEAVQVRLSPLVAGSVLGVGLADLDGAVVDLSDLWGREASRIAEQLFESCSWPDRFALTDVLLARRRESRLAVDPEVAWAWNRIVGTHGQIRVESLAKEVGWSRKRLWSRFRSQIGLPVKRAAKLVRFDLAAHRLVAGQDAARVAADGGYVDQSHLHRDVMAITGVTPVAVASEPFLTVDRTAWPAAGSSITDSSSGSYQGAAAADLRLLPLSARRSS